MTVVAANDDERWRSVLAALYEHGKAMGQILVKHMCETLLQSIERKCGGIAANRSQWYFP